jgi:hypothetical protein
VKKRGGHDLPSAGDGRVVRCPRRESLRARHLPTRAVLGAAFLPHVIGAQHS